MSDTTKPYGPDGQVCPVLTWTGATWGVAGGLASNTPTQGDELLTNGNMETGDPPSGWFGSSGAVILDGVADERTGGAGVQSLSIIDDGTYKYAYQAPTIPIGSWVFPSCWAKKVTGNIQTYMQGIPTPPIVSSTSWTQTFSISRALINNPRFVAQLASGLNGEEARIDDVSVKILSLPTLFRSLVHSSANVLCDVGIVRTANTQAGLVLNLDSAASPANFVIAYLDGYGNCKLDKCVAGVYTNMISAAATYSAGAVIRVVKSGSEYRLFYNNAAVGSVTTIADAGIVSNTLHGLFSTYSANTFDNFACWARGNEGQYSGLDAL